MFYSNNNETKLATVFRKAVPQRLSHKHNN